MKEFSLFTVPLLHHNLATGVQLALFWVYCSDGSFKRLATSAPGKYAFDAVHRIYPTAKSIACDRATLEHHNDSTHHH